MWQEWGAGRDGWSGFQCEYHQTPFVTPGLSRDQVFVSHGNLDPGIGLIRGRDDNINTEQ